MPCCLRNNTRGIRYDNAPQRVLGSQPVYFRSLEIKSFDKKVTYLHVSLISYPPSFYSHTKSFCGPVKTCYAVSPKITEAISFYFHYWKLPFWKTYIHLLGDFRMEQDSSRRWPSVRSRLAAYYRALWRLQWHISVQWEVTRMVTRIFFQDPPVDPPSLVKEDLIHDTTSLSSPTKVYCGVAPTWLTSTWRTPPAWLLPSNEAEL